MKALLVTALLTLLAGCAGTGASGDMGTRSAAGNEDSRSTAGYEDPSERDRIFNSWIN